METQGQQYDVFISHAFEDKASFADKLAESLKRKDLGVWYSGWELKIGDSIADSVNKALNSSVYGIVLISRSYLDKHWAMTELKALFAQETLRDRILPILHGITVEEARLHLPLLADRYAISSEKGVQVVVNRILEVVKGKRRYTRKASQPEPAAPVKKKKRSATEKTEGNTITNTGIMFTGNANVSGGQFVTGNITNKTQHTYHGNENK